MPTQEGELKKLFSQRLSTLMSQKNINQAELSKLVGVSESTVGKWLLMKAIPRMGAIQKLADYFGVGKSYFLEIDPTSEGYYTDPEVAQMANDLKDDPQMRILLDAKKNLSKEEMESIINIAKMMLKKDGKDIDE